MTQTPDIRTRIRIFIYTHIADHGVPPSSQRIATEMSISTEEAREEFETLALSRQVILDPSTREIWMAGPFSAVPTRYRVHGDHVSWWANCAWDMLGIAAFLGRSVRVDATCADCNTSVQLDVDRGAGPANDQGLVHILLPASHWYADIGFT
jgi:hypothetical protein